MAHFEVQKIKVATSSEEQEYGVLVLAGGCLVAVMVKLSGDYHEEAIGHWFLEAGFGRCTGTAPSTFATLGDALLWVAERHDLGEDDLPEGLHVMGLDEARGSGAAAC
jgi:hypothetical protein